MLDYYINTKEYFLSNMYDFLEVYEHYGLCGKNNECTFSSKVYLNVQAKSYKEEGYRILKPWNYLYKFFDENTCEEQRFAVVFGYWYGLSEKSCRMIGNKRWKHLSWSILNALLCGMAENEVLSVILDKSINIESKMRILDAPCKEYEIYSSSNTFKAIRNENMLIDTESQKLYPISIINN